MSKHDQEKVMEEYQGNFNIETLMSVGVHYGHKVKYWNPKMAKYIYAQRSGAHIINLGQTFVCLNKALEKVKEVIKDNGHILFVCTKKQAGEIVKKYAEQCGQYYIHHRWLGGMLTNWKTISASIRTLMHYEELLEKKDAKYTKKELLDISRKKEKLNNVLGGIRKMGGMPDMLFVIDTNVEKLAVLEANKLGIPVVAIVDTNASIEGVDIVIPGNDDSSKAIELYCRLVSEAVLEGIKESLEEDKQEEKKNLEDKNKKVASSKENNKEKSANQEKEMDNTKKVRELREKTGVGILACKKALQETGFDIEKAILYLRKQGMAVASAKSGRETREGIIVSKINNGLGVMIELNSETDFVAKNKKFHELGFSIVEEALKTPDLEKLSTLKESEIANAISVIGENIKLSSVNEIKGEHIFSYIHAPYAENVGKIGVLVSLKAKGIDDTVLSELGNNIAMHIAASSPKSLNVDELDPKLVEREREIFSEQATKDGKSNEIIEKMVEGRIKKFYKEVVLEEQPFVLDGKTPVKDIVANCAKENKGEIKLCAFIRCAVGDK